MTTDILAQPLHNCITRSGYQIQVWWHGNSAAFTSYKRANDELARLQRYEAPQQQALSLLDTLYNQYDAMAEQYEAMVQYIKTTFSLPKLNKVIDQLTADLMAVTECHPQMVQQQQAQATGATAADSEINATSPLNPILAAEYHKQGKMSLYELALVCPDAIKVLNGETVTLGEVTTEDEWPIVSISFDDDDFAPDSLGDLWQPQQVQQAQAQAIGMAMQLAIVESREVAGDSDETVPDSTPILSEWKPLFDWSDYTQTATDQFGNSYTKSANLITVTLANGQQGGGQTAEEALHCALTTPFYTQAELAQFGEMAEANGQSPTLPDSFDGLTRNEIIYHSYLRGLIEDRTELARLAPIAPLYEYKLNVWQDNGGIIGTVSPKVGLSVLWGKRGVPATITAITAWGVTVWRDKGYGDITVFPEHLSDLWLAEDTVSPDSIKPIEQGAIEWTFDCQGFGSGLFFQAFVGSDGYGEWYKVISERGELIKPRTPGSMCDFPAPYSGELTLGDFVEADGANQALGESAEKAQWETRYLGGVITHMEGLL